MIFGPMSQFHGLLCNCEIFANLRLKLYLTRASLTGPPRHDAQLGAGHDLVPLPAPPAVEAVEQLVQAAVPGDRHHAVIQSWGHGDTR